MVRSRNKQLHSHVISTATIGQSDILSAKNNQGLSWGGVAAPVDIKAAGSKKSCWLILLPLLRHRLLINSPHQNKYLCGGRGGGGGDGSLGWNKKERAGSQLHIFSPSESRLEIQKI